MPDYLIETYLARGLPGELSERERRIAAVTEELTKRGLPLRFERSIHVPEDELCFFVLEAPSGADAALAAQRAGLEPLRVVEALGLVDRHHQPEGAP